MTIGARFRCWTAALVVAACGLSGCVAREVQGAQPRNKPRSGQDAGADSKAAPPPDVTKDEVGLTPTQVQDRLGPPTEKHADRWIYKTTPGCSDFAFWEVLTFKNGRVSSVRTERRRTNGHCTVNPGLR